MLVAIGMCISGRWACSVGDGWCVVWRLRWRHFRRRARRPRLADRQGRSRRSRRKRRRRRESTSALAPGGGGGSRLIEWCVEEPYVNLVAWLDGWFVYVNSCVVYDITGMMTKLLGRRCS